MTKLEIIYKKLDERLDLGDKKKKKETPLTDAILKIIEKAQNVESVRIEECLRYARYEKEIAAIEIPTLRYIYNIFRKRLHPHQGPVRFATEEDIEQALTATIKEAYLHILFPEEVYEFFIEQMKQGDGFQDFLKKQKMGSSKTAKKAIYRV